MLHNFLKLPHRADLSFEEKERQKNVTIFSLFTIAVFLTFGTLYLFEGIYLIGTLEIASALLLGINIYCLRYKNTISLSARILVFLVMVMSLIIFVRGGIADTGNLWILTFPMFALLLMDRREGVAWILVYSLLLGMVIALHYWGLVTLHFTFLELRQTLIVFAVFVFLNYFNEKIKIEARKEIDAANQELIEKDRLLMEQSKVVEIGKMMQDVSHQFQHPLNTVGLMLQNLPDDYDDGWIDKPYIEKLVNDSMLHIQYITHTLDDFRLLFHADRKKNFFTVGTVVHAALELLAGSLKGYSIHFELIDDSTTELYTFENDLMRAIFNILHNAKDAIIAKRQMRESGKTGNILVRTYEDNGSVYISVEDDAGTIPTDTMKRLFDPYCATHTQCDVRFIGLYMAKKIIEKNLGGSLVLTNQANGALFTVTLPKKRP